MKKPFCLNLIAGFVIFVSGCSAGGGGGTATSKDASDGVNRSEMATVEVFNYAGAVQCYGGGMDIEEMQQELTDNGITVISAYSDNDGCYHISTCGAETGAIHVYEIPSTDLDDALALGYSPVEDLSDASVKE